MTRTATAAPGSRVMQLCTRVQLEGGVWDGKRALAFYRANGFDCTLQRARVNLEKVAERFPQLLTPVEGKRWTYEASATVSTQAEASSPFTPRGEGDCGRFCVAPDELQDALGHDGLGHLVARRLRNAKIETLAALRALSPAEIMGIRGLAKGALQRIEQQGLLGEEFRARDGRRALLHFRAATGVRLTLAETRRLIALIDFARDQDWDIVGMSVSSGAPSSRQWEQALKELDEGHVDHLAYWDHDASKPVVRTRKEQR
ncbi:helix-hairpin-helix domain-containing protein [Streptomyces longispororuber]|uniref:helix-hairpin-helix domain-containing protein n=1 Tax=Streptomyces longispororuber TaxID=68230 RepID=UPI0036FF507E